jgi:hypothetical protein
MTFTPAPRPRALRALNGAWGAAQKIGVGRTSLDEASLIRAARRSSGLHDFGEDFAASTTREPMRRLLASVDAEARLHPLGRMIARQTFVRSLVSRLRLEQAMDLHPEIAALPVAAPVFIVGLQRTGTTLLHRLLACEPTLRPLISWEALSPAPLPGSAAYADGSRASDEPDPRTRLAEVAERALRYMAPEFFAIHPVEAYAPEEDVLLMDATFISPTADVTFRVPSYSAYFEEVDQTPAYRYLRRMIQLLLWQRGGRYLGKTPHHLENLDALLEVFPDARIIQTHRDPLRVVASFCSMITHGRRVFSDDVDPHEVGEMLGRKAVRAVTDSMEVRDRRGAGQFLDVAYADMVSDPMKQIRRIYDFIDCALTPETEQVMRGWLGGNPQNKHGVHRYQLEDFGLDREPLSAQLVPYRERYEIPEE